MTPATPPVLHEIYTIRADSVRRVHSVLLVGVPRGGTTWAGQVLGHTRGAVYVHEPDGTHEPIAFRAKLHHYPQPMLDADAPRAAAPDLAALFDGALAGGAPAGTWRDRLARKAWSGVTGETKVEARKTGRLSPRLRLAIAGAQPRVAVHDKRVDHVVVKSVASAFSVEWVARHCAPDAVGVISRHPLNVLASWRQFGWTAPFGPMYRSIVVRAADRWNIELPPPDAPIAARAAAIAGALQYALHLARSEHGWVAVSHEVLCTDPAVRFADVAAQLGLEWNAEAAAFVAERDRPGEGYATQRVTAELPEQWRHRLDADEIATASDVLERFTDAPWLATLPRSS